QQRPGPQPALLLQPRRGDRRERPRLGYRAELQPVRRLAAAGLPRYRDLQLAAERDPVRLQVRDLVHGHPSRQAGSGYPDLDRCLLQRWRPVRLRRQHHRPVTGLPHRNNRGGRAPDRARPPGGALMYTLTWRLNAAAAAAAIVALTPLAAVSAVAAGPPPAA